jgi:hypothetical protein
LKKFGKREEDLFGSGESSVNKQGFTRDYGFLEKRDYCYWLLKEDCFAKFKVLTPVLLKIHVFCDITVIDTAQRTRRFELLFTVFVEFLFHSSLYC